LFARRRKREYGVRAAVITAFLEARRDSAPDMGNYQAIKSPHPSRLRLPPSQRCFRGHLFDPRDLLERGDLQPAT